MMESSEQCKVIDFQEWVKQNEGSLKPPVMNKLIFPQSDDFIVMAVGGPNQRVDYHVNPYEEIFFQMQGTLRINIIRPQDGKPDTIEVP